MEPAAPPQVALESSTLMLPLTLAGTTVAAAVYPLLLVLGEFVAPNAFGLDALDGAERAAFALIGGVVGFGMALAIGITVGIVFEAAAWLCGIRTDSLWFASIVGGWTGYFATQLVTESLPRADPYFAATGLAIVTGQAGAAAFAYLGRRLHFNRLGYSFSSSDARFGLRQMFGATTVVAVFVAIGQSVEIQSLAAIPLGFAVAVQASTIGLSFLALAARRRWTAESFRFT